MLNLANPRAERDGHAKNEGGNTWICQTKHLHAQFGKCEDGEGAPANPRVGEWLGRQIKNIEVRVARTV